jgi:hypothetical protein
MDEIQLQHIKQLILNQNNFKNRNQKKTTVSKLPKKKGKKPIEFTKTSTIKPILHILFSINTF